MSAPERTTPVAAEKEALISLTALFFIEEYHLLPKDKLVDARNSLQALFLHTSGEETLLHKLIETLKITQGVQRSFAQIATILDGIRTSAAAVDNKITALRVILEIANISAEANAAFVGPFLSFSQMLTGRIGSFTRALEGYIETKEEEARLTNTYRIARQARDRLKQRFSSGLGAETRGAVETRIKNEVVSSFDYQDAERNLKYARRESKNKEQEVTEHLAGIQAMCQQAMNPAMRDKDDDAVKAAAEYDDVFMLFSQALRNYPQLLQIKDQVVELFKMYQHGHGLFSHDFQNLNRSVRAMIENPDAYFENKEEDLDLRSKRDKLHRIEGLIPLLEHGADMLTDEELDQYVKFSRRLSEAISTKGAPWVHICEDLLRAKIQAEADLSTQL